MRRLLPALALVVLPSACGGADDTDATLTVLAAASLTETFEELGRRFEAEHPGVEVRLAFDSSATLAQQALEGAPADVLATADEDTMTRAADALAGPPVLFAGNRLTLVTPAGNPAGVRDADDLDRAGVDWVACVETAPCGRITQQVLDDLAVSGTPASLEVDVKAVLAKVSADEADAGFVYRTDAVAAGAAVETVPLDLAPTRGVTRYPIAILAQSGQPALAREFLDLVLSSAGAAVLAEAGFGAAPAGAGG